jgi:hypothetical protein
MKGNRSEEQSIWVAEEIAPAAPTDLTLSLISGGLRLVFTDHTGGTNPHEVWAKIDSGSYALLYTLTAGTVTKDDLRTPEDLVTIEVRSKGTTLFSTFCIEQSIVMLGANLIPSASSDFATDGSAYWTSTGTKTYNAGTHDLTITQASGILETWRDNLPVVGHAYLSRVDAKSTNNTGKLKVFNASSYVYTDITNLSLTTSYQTFKAIGTQAGNRYLEIATIQTGNKDITYDNIKLQEVL